MSENKTIEHIAIIMDGNGRWATKQGMPRAFGHIEGAKRVSDLSKWAIKYKVKYLTLYAFSSENWKRPQEEVDALMGLLKEYLLVKTQELIENDIKLQIIGRVEELNVELQELIKQSLEATKNNKTMTLSLALNYGGRGEIVDATKKIVELVQKGNLKVEDITEEIFAQNLYIPEIPDPELVIRTSGELRISNFLLWQLSYSEFFITETLWPDFDEKTFVEAMDSYHNRDRRKGGI